MNARRTRPYWRPSAASWRLCGSMPSRHTRVSSAPNTVSTAPPASTPSRCVRPDGSWPAASAAFSRLPLVLAIAPPLREHVGLGQLAEEDPAEPQERAQRGAGAATTRTERRELLGEVAYADAQDARSDELGRGVLVGLDVPAQHAREQRRRVAPEVEPRVVAHELVAGHRQRMADSVAEEQPVQHVLDARLGVHEQVEHAALDREAAAQRVALDPAEGAGLTHRVAGEAVDVVDRDREVELEERRARAVGRRAAVEVGLPERDVAEHLLGEPDGRGLRGDGGGGHEAAASAAGVGSRMRSAKRSARAAIVKLGFGPTRPGLTEPSAMCRPG